MLKKAMKKYNIPTLFALILLLTGVLAGIFLLRSKQILDSQASVDELPRGVKITNITDNSFTVSWLTTRQVAGFVAYGTTTNLGETAWQEATLGEESIIHYVTLENLKPDRLYYFKIGSGTKLFGKQNTSSDSVNFYQAKTALKLTSLPSPDVIFGSVVDRNKQPTPSIIVYVNGAGISPLSALTTKGGQWIIPLSTARKTDLKAFAVYKKSTLLEITVQSLNTSASAQVKVESAHPVPQIELGRVHDFTKVAPVSVSDPPNSQINIEQSNQSQPPPKTSSNTSENLAQSNSGFSTAPLQGVKAKSRTQEETKPTPRPTPTPTPRPKTQAQGSLLTPTPSPKTSFSEEISLPEAGNLTVTSIVFIMGSILFTAGFFLPKTNATTST